MAPVNTNNQLNKLRALMRSNEIDVQAYVVPSGDAHQSEYIADVDARRAYISGFDGSAGLAVITLNNAALFTDGRYYLQASQQLNESWTLMRQGEKTTPSWQEWVTTQVGSGRVGVDPQLTSIQDAKVLIDKLNEHGKGATIVPVKSNLIDKVWDEQPARPANPVQVLGLEFAGVDIHSKLADVRKELAKDNSYGIVISALDEIAWLFNLRGGDIQYNPVFFAYALVTKEEAVLYVNPDQITDAVKGHLGSAVKLAPYHQIFEDLLIHRSNIEATSKGTDGKLILTQGTSLAIRDSVDASNVALKASPVVALKAIKNKVELDGFRNCHVRDGASLCQYFAWLEATLTAPNYTSNPLTEAAAADKLLEFRSKRELFVGESFATISSTGPNGAIIHYHPRHGACDDIKADAMYLCDSGAQYKDGTTDVTRTWHFGTPTAFEKEAFTRVLQGVITLETQTIPQGTTGFHLDSITRAPLWRSGLDFRHGVGHGVGSYLNVHEGPHGIGFRLSYLDTPLQEGMTVTNEPGYYEDFKFGIRTENILLIKKAKGLKNFGNIEYLGFENVTLAPIHTKLIQKDLLSKFEVDYLNSYHQRVYSTLEPLLQNDSTTLQWLKRHTQPI